MTNHSSIAGLQSAWQVISRQSLLPAVQERFASSTGISLPRTARQALVHLAECEGAVISELATLAGVDISTMSRALRHLDEAGFIRRQPGDDQRAVVVSITEAGQQAVSRHLTAGQELLAEVLAGWAQDDLDQLAQLMTRFAGDFAAFLRGQRGVTEPAGVLPS